jgi:hypothetical protein
METPENQNNQSHEVAPNHHHNAMLSPESNQPTDEDIKSLSERFQQIREGIGIAYDVTKYAFDVQGHYSRAKEKIKSIPAEVADDGRQFIVKSAIGAAALAGVSKFRLFEKTRSSHRSAKRNFDSLVRRYETRKEDRRAQREEDERLDIELSIMGADRFIENWNNHIIEKSQKKQLRQERITSIINRSGETTNDLLARIPRFLGHTALQSTYLSFAIPYNMANSYLNDFRKTRKSRRAK